MKDNGRIGTRIDDRYELLELIGEGGMGVVYRARDIEQSRDVALKLLHPQLTCIPQVVERFFREARATAELSCSHIVRASGFGRTDNGDCFLVMELLGGMSLRDLVKQGQVLAIPRALHIALQTAEALRFAHDQGVVHRDLKPGNIQLVEHGGDPDFVKVLDFGLAKIAEEGGPELTRTGMILGSPAYMSPEQAAGRRADHRADIYALGVVLYEMLVGEPPFAGMSPPQTLLCQINVPPVPPRQHRPDVPESLERLVLTCLAKSPEERPSSMSDLYTALRMARDRHRSGSGSAAASDNKETPNAPWAVPPGRDGSPVAAGVLQAEAGPGPGSAARSTARSMQMRPSPRGRLRWLGLLVALLIPGALWAYFALVTPPGAGKGTVVGAAATSDAGATAGASGRARPDATGAPRPDAVASATGMAVADVSTTGMAVADASTTGIAVADASTTGIAVADASTTGAVIGLAHGAGGDPAAPLRGAAPATQPALDDHDDEDDQSLSNIPAETPDKEQPQVVILSSPGGAEVFDGPKSLGKTPLTLPSDTPRQLVVKRKGYQPVRLSIASRTTGILSAELVHEDKEDDEDEAGANSQRSPKAALRHRRRHHRKRRRRHRKRRRRRRRKRHRIHSLSRLYKLYRRRRIKRSTYRRLRRRLIRERRRRLRIIARLYRRRRLTRNQYRRYVRAIRRYYR